MTTIATTAQVLAALGLTDTLKLCTHATLGLKPDQLPTLHATQLVAHDPSSTPANLTWVAQPQEPEPLDLDRLCRQALQRLNTRIEQSAREAASATALNFATTRRGMVMRHKQDYLSLVDRGRRFFAIGNGVLVDGLYSKDDIKQLITPTRPTPPSTLPYWAGTAVIVALIGLMQHMDGDSEHTTAVKLEAEANRLAAVQVAMARSVTP